MYQILKNQMFNLGSIFIKFAYPSDENERTYYHNIHPLGEIAVHEAPLHFHTITFHQVLNGLLSFDLYYQLKSKANLFLPFGQSKIKTMSKVIFCYFIISHKIIISACIPVE